MRLHPCFFAFAGAIIACGGRDAQPHLVASASSPQASASGAAPVTSSAPAASPSASAAVPADADGDGVPDERDVCPRERGPDDQDPKVAGCPWDAPPRPSRKAEPLRVSFELGPQPRKLSEDEHKTLNDVASSLTKTPKVTLLTVSSAAANANAWNRLIGDYLIAGGIDAERLVKRACVSSKAKVRSVVAEGDVPCTEIVPAP